MDTRHWQSVSEFVCNGRFEAEGVDVEQSRIHVTHLDVVKWDVWH